ncbi:acyl-CoA dehydrogenase [Spirillospora sp. NPDC048911]|uniref:acyl-CoA dehydrogenase n=1 Tax=Spirillospora sp. NPDC048911 TaxID=3364527 RepID=UPI003716F9EC
MGTAPQPDPGLSRLVRGAGLTAKTRARLEEAVPGEFFGYPDGLTVQDRHALTYERLRRAGLAAPPAPELLDDPPALCALLERAAIADPGLFHVMLLHYTLALGPILLFGSEQQGPRAARDALESMESFGALLMTEVGRSNSHLAPRTLARYDAATREFVLTTPDDQAVKFPTNTAHPAIPKIAAVYATLEHDGVERGVFVFAVPVRGPGGAVPAGAEIVPAPDTTGLMVDYAAVRLSGLRVPYEAWLRDGATIGAGGQFHDPVGGPAARLTRSMSIGPAVWRAVISMAAAITRAAAGILHAHAAGRVTLGRLAPLRPLTDYRNVREAVLESLASAYALTVVAAHVKERRAGAARAGGPATAWAPWSAVDRDLALLKAATTMEAQETVSRCRVLSGAPGFAATDRLNGYRGLAHAYMNAGGDNELILFDTARAMADLDRYEPPAVDGAVPDGGDLSSPRVWVHLARDCELRLQRRLAGRIEAARAAGHDGFESWNDNLSLAVRTATACADRTVLEILAAACEPEAVSGSGPLRPLLGLHALGWLERRAGVLLDEGVAEPGLLERVAERRRAVCDALAPDAAALAAALELPPEVTAPTAFVDAR